LTIATWLIDLTYLGILILALISVQLLMLGYGQFRRIRNSRRTQLLEMQLLEERIAEHVSRRTAANAQIMGWAGWRKFRIMSMVDEAESIKSFYLVPHDGKPLPKFLPGQYLTFRLKVPGISKPVVRCYSLSDSGDFTQYYRVSIKHQLGPVGNPDASDGVASSYFHQHLDAGDIVDVKAPAGKFCLDMTEKTPVVLIAAGIGLTPLLSMLNTLCQTRSNREVWLFYGVQSESQLMMTEHLESISAGNRNFHLHRFFSRQAITPESGKHAFHQGHISAEAIQDVGTPMSADFYLCGPGSMMNSVVTGLINVGVDRDRIHFESFGPANIRFNPVENSGSGNDSLRENSVKARSDDSIPVTFGVSDKTVEWSRESGTLLDAAETAGVQIENGCRSGSCGTCLTAILAGEVEYLEEPDTAVEQGSCLPCVSIPKGELKLNA
jgi:uncharacterized protein